MKDRIKHISYEMEQLFEISGKNYDLCYESEIYLFDDIESERVCLVNDTFLMKTTGVPAGIAIRDGLAIGGSIKRGFWYELSIHDDRYKIKQIAQSGGRRVTIPGRSSWVEVREMRKYVGGRRISGEDLTKMAQNKAEEIKKNFPSGIMLK